MLREVLVGREDPEGFFGMCVSALGHQETRSQFLSLIQPLSTANSSLHAILTSIYKEYFSQVSGCVIAKYKYKVVARFNTWVTK